MTINRAEVGIGRAATFWVTRSRRSPGWPTRWHHAANPSRRASSCCGSVVETRWVEQGDLVEASIEGLGPAIAQFTDYSPEPGAAAERGAPAGWQMSLMMGLP